MKSIKIAGTQGFYGDSPMGALAICMEKGANYLIQDALSELTLSILQKDKLKDPNLGYARDIELHAKVLYPLAKKRGIKIITNAGGLNPIIAAQKIQTILAQQGITDIKIAAITGDDLFSQLTILQQNGEVLANMDSDIPFSTNTFQISHANVYTGAKEIALALEAGADIVLGGRIADPCLTLGILLHEFKWNLEGDLNQNDLDLLASGIVVGHLLECGGQASGGNSYAEWPMNYSVSNLGYPIAEVFEDGTSYFSKLASQGGIMTRNTLCEQLIYEIHDPKNYITPDVIADFSTVQIEMLEENKVKVWGATGKNRPEKLKLCIGLVEGFLTDQFFFFSWPYAYSKSQKFIQATQEIWSKLPIQLERTEFQMVGLNGIHGSTVKLPSLEELDEMNELGVRVVIQHKEAKFGKMAMQSIICLGLNGPPGIVSVPGWGNDARIQLSLWPTLIDREWVKSEWQLI